METIDINEAIRYFEEKEKELRIQAEEVRPIGEATANPRSLYNETFKKCREEANFYEQVADWLSQLKDIKESELPVMVFKNNYFTLNKEHLNVLLKYEEEKVVREYLIEHFGLGKDKTFPWNYPIQ